MVGGSADVVSGAYEHTINMQGERPSPSLRSRFEGRYAGIVLAGSSRPRLRNALSAADLEGLEDWRDCARFQHEHVGGEPLLADEAG